VCLCMRTTMVRTRTDRGSGGVPCRRWARKGARARVGGFVDGYVRVGGDPAVLCHFMHTGTDHRQKTTPTSVCIRTHAASPAASLSLSRARCRSCDSRPLVLELVEDKGRDVCLDLGPRRAAVLAILLQKDEAIVHVVRQARQAHLGPYGVPPPHPTPPRRSAGSDGQCSAAGGHRQTRTWRRRR
jgi:hypothetical protein